MKRILPVFTLFTFFSPTLPAQTPDWSSEIASIIYDNCSSCHHEGGIGPMALMSYDDAVTHGTTIQDYVVSRKMPPWPADYDCSYPMLHDRSLSDDEVTAIDDWVNGGMPSGDLGQAPVPPTFNENSQLDVIDETISIPEYTVQLSTDEYRSFAIHSNYTTPHYINQIEVIPGNDAIVHHVLVYYDPTPNAYNNDMADPEPGFSTNGANTPSPTCIMIGGWAPGAQATKLPVNMAYQIPANADFVVEVHYANGSLGQTDATQINVKYSTETNPRLVKVEPVLFHYVPCISPALYIPANSIKSFTEKSLTFLYNGDYSLLGVAPHCHLLGKTWNVYMTSPGNADTTQLLCIPNWDFHWQLSYGFKNLVRWNAGDGYTLRAEATYDNTSNNPNNPSNPPIDVALGESTTDEMMVVFFSFLDYEEGDENINLEVTGINELPGASSALQVYPNPANDQVELSSMLSEGGDVFIRITNISGMILSEVSEGFIPKGIYSASIDVSAFPAGIYFVELKSGNEKVVEKLVKE